MFPTTPQAFVEAMWRGEQRRFALALFKGFIYFWEPDSLQFQAAPQEWVFAVDGVIPHSNYKTINPDFLVSVFQAALQDRKMGRMLHPDIDKSVFLHLDGVGSISSRKLRGRGETFLFRFAGGEEVFTQNYSYWLALAGEWANQPESDFAFALDWRGKNDETRAQCLTQLCAGTWDELRRVALWILTLEGHDYIHGFEQQATIFVRLYCSNERFSYELGAEDDEFLTKRQLLWDEWLKFFGLVLDTKIVELHMVARQTAERGFGWNYFRVAVELSQHEQLETRLLLRDWLRGRARLSEERIAELLG